MGANREKENNRIPKERSNWQNGNCCRLGLIEPVMDCTENCKLPSTPSSTGLSRIQH
jgi:hypothetical protein